MLVYNPCLYLHDYSIFVVTTEPEQNWGLWKVREKQREQQGHNSNETSWGGFSAGYFFSTWWVLPFSCAGRALSQEPAGGLAIHSTHRGIWFGRDLLKITPFQPPCYGQGCFPLDQAVPSPIYPGPVYSQGRGIHNFCCC